MKLIIHIDLNAFFAQVEINRHPEYQKKPLAVGGGIRGVVATCSYEARKFGVRSGMNIYDAIKLCPDLILLPGDYGEYRKQSNRFFSVVVKTIPTIEMASIDECYGDATDYLQDVETDRPTLHDRLFDLQLSLYRETGLKCSIGLGHTRFMAKMGSDYKKPLGITILLDPVDWKTKIWPLDIGKMYGIGSKTAPRLKELGIKTIGDLATGSIPGSKEILGSEFEYLVALANGFGSDVVSTESRIRKSCGTDVTLPTDTTDYDEIRNRMRECAMEVAQTIAKDGLESRTICIKLRNSDFKTNTKRMTFSTYSNSETDIIYRALTILDSFYRGEPIRLLGVAAEDLKPVGDAAIDLRIPINKASRG